MHPCRSPRRTCLESTDSPQRSSFIRLKLGKIQKRIQESHRITLEYDEALLNEVAARCTEVESGARNVDNILSNTMLPDLSRQLLGRLAAGTPALKVVITVRDGAFQYDWEEMQ